ncbi:MAG: UDP-3-O-acyl-N-acetylglucosamine deacetylase [Bacteroidales bacterium]|nr:UDP-3-O-acyl-N-acetylglucosamine deacetylase [Bacteroidales bacterium]
MIEKQRTLQNEIVLTGKGLHSGREVTLKIMPADTNHGYVFQRADLEGMPTIKGVAENVVSTARGTTLMENNAEIMTIEHCCAALYSLGVDNALIQVDGPEVPILDGSSKYFVEAIVKVGTAEQDKDRNYFEPKEEISLKEENGSEISIQPHADYSVEVKIDFNSKTLGVQQAKLTNLADFKDEISACKTFVFLHEIEMLAKMNLIKGGDLDNALVIVDRKMEQEELDRLAALLNKPKVEVLPEGILNNTKLTFKNEPARHKLLDVVGDLSLTGVRIKGKIVANKPGHNLNTTFAKKLRKLIAE